MSKQQPRCAKCGSHSVTWKQSKAGKWYLADVEYNARGREVSQIPHFTTCKNSSANQQVLADEEALRAEVREYMKWDGNDYIDTRTGELWKTD